MRLFRYVFYSTNVQILQNFCLSVPNNGTPDSFYDKLSLIKNVALHCTTKIIQPIQVNVKTHTRSSMVVPGKTDDNIFWYLITAQHTTMILQQMYIVHACYLYFNQNLVHWSHFSQHTDWLRICKRNHTKFPCRIFRCSILAIQQGFT